MTSKTRQLQQQADAVREFNRFYTLHLGVLRGRYLDTDLSLSEGRILYELSLNPSCTANDLRHKLGLDAGYMSRLLRALTTRSLVHGQRSQHDKRSTLLSLTDAGLAAMADLNQRASAEAVRMLNKLDDNKRQELLAALGAVQKIVSAPARPAQSAHVAADAARAARAARAAHSAPQVIRAGAAHLNDATHLLTEYFDLIGVVVRDDDAAIRAFLNDATSALWIAYVDGQPAGCVAMRPLPELGHAVECKRLYVGGAFRRRGLAEMLMQALEAHAIIIGHDAVYLDTKDDLHAAIKLYHQLGYENCARYNDNAQATIFMRKPLR